MGCIRNSKSYCGPLEVIGEFDIDVEVTDIDKGYCEGNKERRLEKAQLMDMSSDLRALFQISRVTCVININDDKDLEPIEGSM